MNSNRRSIRFLIYSIWPVAILVLLLLLFAVIADLYGDRSFGKVVIEALIRVVMVVALYMFSGNSGVLSFGHVAFAGIGAFAAAWVSVRSAFRAQVFPDLPAFILDSDLSPLPSTLVAGALAASVALVVGIVILRLSGLGAAIATFAVLAIVQSIYSHFQGITCGTCTVMGFPRFVSVWVAFAWAAVTVLVAYIYQISPFGLSLRASRDDEIAAQASGVRVIRERLIAFVISAFFMGVAGALYASSLGSTSMQLFWLDMTFLILVMMIVGGKGSLAGAVLGVVAVSAFIWVLRRLEAGVPVGAGQLSLPTGAQEFGLAIMILLVLIFRPNGLFGTRELIWPLKRSFDGRVETERQEVRSE